MISMFKESPIFFFDCDGVILDSNCIKSKGFLEVTKKYGEDIANRFLDYHRENGGISRFHKFKYFLEVMLDKKDIELEYNSLLENYATYLRDELRKSELSDGFIEFMSKYSNESHVVSGGKESELLDVFSFKLIDKYFSSINGSPRSKYEIVESIIEKRDIDLSKSVFFGDSRLDFEVSQKYKMKFVFLYEFTEFQDWENFFQNYPTVVIAKNFKELLDN